MSNTKEKADIQEKVTFTVKLIFSRRWILTTILAVAGVLVLIRLGIWQLDRLDQRRTFNARALSGMTAPLLVINEEAFNLDLYDMEYREVQVTGQYDFNQEIALRNQHWENQWGVHLVTPVLISGTDKAVLVDRGWIPSEDYLSGNWSQFEEPAEQTIQGIIRRPREKADFGSRTDPEIGENGRIDSWNFINTERIQEQLEYKILPVYIQQKTDSSWTSLPYRTQPEIEITEGPHFGYALQWFTFAAILALGYPVFVYRVSRPKTDEVK